MMKHISLKKHSFDNLGGFENKHEIFFSNPNCNIIMGTNGAGKSSILNSLYINISHIFTNIINFHHSNIDFSTSNINNGKVDTTCTSTFNFDINGKIEELEIGFRLSQNNQIQQIDSDYNKMRNEIKRIFETQDLNLPVIRYFRANRSINKNQSIVQSQNFNKVNSRNIGYTNHYAPTFLIQEITSFIIDLLNIENQEKIKNKNFDFETKFGKFVRNVFREFTISLYENEMPISVGKSKFSNGQSLFIKKNNEDLEFSQLSSGEEYLISLVLEILYRICQTNPNSENPRFSPGIIIIDEIESHLHPKWQINVTKALTNAFPKIQFIISTHSPLIVSSVKTEQINLISNFQIQPKESIPDIYSGTANQILTELMNADEKIDEFKNETSFINKLILEKKYEHAKDQLNLLKNKVDSNPDWLMKLEKRINFISI